MQDAAFILPGDISWSPRDLVEPDLLLIHPDQAKREWLEIDHLLLVGEVLSRSTWRNDVFTKRRLYQRHVPTSWIFIDAKTVHVWHPSSEARGAAISLDTGFPVSKFESMSLALALPLLASSEHNTDHPAIAAESCLDPAAIAAERALVGRVQSGDVASFEALMQAYFTRIVRFTYGIVEDRAVAEDVAQDVFARIWTMRAEWRPLVSVRAYLFGAARHRALDLIKHRGVEQRAANEQIAVARDAHAPAADVEMAQAMEVSRLQHAVDTLPERRRMALSLRYDLGLSHAEVGAALGVSAKAAKELILRTLDTLRRELRER